MGVGKSTPPNPDDDIKVLAEGTLGGQHWRLVRDRFVVGVGASGTGPGSSGHLPISQMGQTETEICEFTGMQWGDRAPGTVLDFDSGGACGTKDPGNTGLTRGIVSMAQDAPEGNVTLPIMAVTGSVNASKIVSVTLTSGGRSSAVQPVIALPGEAKGYFVFFGNAWTLNYHPTYTVTGYDAQGNVVASQDQAYH
jgi:hypothetical protein